MTNDQQEQSHDSYLSSGAISLSKWSRWQDWSRLGLGFWLVLTPFTLTGSRAFTLTDWIGGSFIIATALWTLIKPYSHRSVWLAIIVASGLIVLPSLLGYIASVPAAWSSYFTNLTLLLLCGWSLDKIRKVEERSA